MAKFAFRIGLVILAAAGTAAALTSEQVVVVANSRSPDSISLAQYYARQRDIPAQNIVTIDTTTSQGVSYNDYVTQIRDPLRQVLVQRKLADKARCLALMYGVPVRIAQAVGSQQADLLKAYRAALSQAHYRLAIDYELLGTVNRKFPPPQVRGLKPIGKLFPSRQPEPRTPLAPTAELNENISTLLSVRQRQILEIMDPSRRRIAERQLMALHLDLYGLNGLISYIGARQPQGAPDPEDLRRQLLEAQRKLDALGKQPATSENLQARLDLMEAIDGVSVLCAHLEQKIKEIRPPQSRSALDSELALLWWSQYPLQGRLPNPLHWRLSRQIRGTVPPVLMVARIDGPSKADAMSIIKASLRVEKAGLDGVFYIDAGGGAAVKAAEYEVHLRNLYAFLKAHTKLQVVLDDKPEVFAKDTCPDAALYVGWYKLRQYVPAFTWKPGAVGWHIASFEAENLRDPNSSRWCVKMIQNGVAATMGAVDEPTLGAFPTPIDFFALLLTGRWTIAECYWRTTPMVSWRMTLIADPLYNPFAARPQLSVDALPEGLAP